MAKISKPQIVSGKKWSFYVIVDGIENSIFSPFVELLFKGNADAWVKDYPMIGGGTAYYIFAANELLAQHIFEAVGLKLDEMAQNIDTE